VQEEMKTKQEKRVDFVLSILLNLGVKIPSPAKPIENFVEMSKDFFIHK
jgi:hypothetical protein